MASHRLKSMGSRLKTNDINLGEEICIIYINECTYSFPQYEKNPSLTDGLTFQIVSHEGYWVFVAIVPQQAVEKQSRC